MDKPSKGDEHLDMEYLNTLRNIKPYITCIMNNHYIELVRVWLEKLSDIKLDNKALRNEYLVELGKQIVSGVFVEPFIDPPGDGTLPVFESSWKNQSLEATKGSTNPWVQAANKVEQSNQPQSPVIATNLKDKTSPQRTNQNAVSARTVRKSAQDRLDEVRENINKMHQFTKELNNKTSAQTSGKTLKKKKSKIRKQTAIRNQQSQQANIYPVLQAPYGGQCINGMGVYDRSQNTDLYIPLKHTEKILKRPPDDESSWMDLTDNISTTLTVYGSGDATSRGYDVSEAMHLQEAYEHKIASLMEMIEELKEENSMLTQHVDMYQKDLRSTKAETSIHNLATEVECLKSRLQELVDIKTSLQNNKISAVSEWQNTAAILQRKLSILQKRYNDLKMENNELIRRQQEVEMEKRKEMASQKQKLMEIHGREIDMLKEVHARAITDLESKLNQTMVDLEIEYSRKMTDVRESHENRLTVIKEEFDHRIAHITAEYETKLRLFKAEYEEKLSQKDTEVDKLEQLLHEQCMRMQEEVQLIRNQIESNIANNSESYLEKIAFLQKCIIKMEKLYQRAEKENGKQIAKLRKELAYKTKTNQLALTSQKAELLASSYDGKQLEVEQIFAELEAHYKNLIMEQQKRALEEKRQDTKIIDDLKNELAKYLPEY